MITSLILNEVNVFVSLSFEIWDFAGDSYLFYKILEASPEARQEMGDVLLLCSIVFFTLAVLVSILAAYLKLNVLVSLRKRRNVEFAFSTAQDDEYTAKHIKRKGDQAKSLQMAYANLLAGLLEDLPLGLIGLRFIQLSAARPDLFEPISFVLLLSVFSSGFMLGIKLAKLPLLKGLFEEESKQKKKIERATLGDGAEDLLTWLKSIPGLRIYIDVIKEKGTTGAQLVQVESDAPLIALDMHSEVHRKCLLLQLARVRARTEKNRISQQSTEASEGARPEAGLVFEPDMPNRTEEQGTTGQGKPREISVEMQERPPRHVRDGPHKA